MNRFFSALLCGAIGVGLAGCGAKVPGWVRIITTPAVTIGCYEGVKKADIATRQAVGSGLAAASEALSTGNILDLSTVLGQHLGGKVEPIYVDMVAGAINRAISEYAEDADWTQEDLVVYARETIGDCAVGVMSGLAPV